MYGVDGERFRARSSAIDTALSTFAVVMVLVDGRERGGGTRWQEEVERLSF